MAKLLSPAIQWYFKQWLGDQKVLAMDWDANGMHFWLINLSLQENPAGTIPNDMALIRRWLRNPSDDVWRRVQPQIFNAWTLQDGRWHQKGAEEAAIRQLDNSEKRRLAAEARWGNRSRDANALHMDMQKPCSSSSSSSLKQKTKPTPQAAFVLPNWIPRKNWDAWIEMRKKKRNFPTEHAMQLAVDRLETLRVSGSPPDQVLDQSTFRGWTGLFEVNGSALTTNYGNQRYS